MFHFGKVKECPLTEDLRKSREANEKAAITLLDVIAAASTKTTPAEVIELLRVKRGR